MNDSLSTNTIKQQNTDEKEVVNLLTVYKIEVYLLMGKGYTRGLTRISHLIRDRLLSELNAEKNSKGHYMCTKKNAWDYFSRIAKNKLEQLKVSSYDELYYNYMKNNY